MRIVGSNLLQSKKALQDASTHTEVISAAEKMVWGKLQNDKVQSIMAIL